jgi:hypothetical protein
MADSADPRLVRLVTRHFVDLQGLRIAAFAPFYLAASCAWLATSSELPVVVWGGSAMVFALALIHMLDGFYGRLGRVRMAERTDFLWRWLGLIAVVLLFAEAHTRSGAPSVVWLVCSVYPLWLAADGWPLRWWHLGTFASMVYVAFGRASYSDPPAFAWMAPRIWAFSFALIATGIADHYLLLRMMRVARLERTVLDDANSI